MLKRLLLGSIHFIYFAPYLVDGLAPPKAVNGLGWVGCMFVVVAFDKYSFQGYYRLILLEVTMHYYLK